MTSQDGAETDERARLRAVLGFPAAIETIDGVAGRGAAPSAEPVDERDALQRRLDAMDAKVDKLGVHLDVLRALLDEVLDRLDTDHQPAAVTVEEVADIAARVVRVIETRLEAHVTPLQAELAELREAIESPDTPNLQRVK